MTILVEEDNRKLKEKIRNIKNGYKKSYLEEA